jgi:pimeloyl-ACP methyl ester carboxylesterase
MHPVIECLSGAFRVIAIDLPGFGESRAPSGVWGTPDYAAFVRDLLAELGIERALFLGHSFGAKVSLYLAAVHPDLVEKVVLSGAPGIKMPPSMEARVKKAVAKSARTVGRLGPPGRMLKQAVYERIASSDYKDAGPLQPILVKVVNEDLTHMFPRVKASTLLVWGSEDTAVPLAAAQRMEELMGDAGLVVFEGAGHFAYLDEPQRFCRVVRHFFGSPIA